jgi:hypothetical protein
VKKLKIAQVGPQTSAALEIHNSVRVSNSARLARAYNAPVLPIFSSSGSASLPEITEARHNGLTQAISAPGKRFKPLATMRPPSTIPGNTEVTKASPSLLDLEPVRVKAQSTKL